MSCRALLSPNTVRLPWFSRARITSARRTTVHFGKRSLCCGPSFTNLIYLIVHRAHRGALSTELSCNLTLPQNRLSCHFVQTLLRLLSCLYGTTYDCVAWKGWSKRWILYCTARNYIYCETTYQLLLTKNVPLSQLLQPNFVRPPLSR
jgi:hypothetical protein